MLLTPETYHSPEARAAYISSSDVKLAMRCEAMWAAQDKGLHRRPEGTAAFAYGHLFEEALCGNAEAYIAEHPELTVTRGARKGEDQRGEERGVIRRICRRYRSRGSRAPQPLPRRPC